MVFLVVDLIGIGTDFPRDIGQLGEGFGIRLAVLKVVRKFYQHILGA